MSDSGAPSEERSYPVILENPTDVQHVVAKVGRSLDLDDYSRMRLRRKTLDDEEMMGGQLIDADEKERIKREEARQERRAKSALIRRQRRKREAWFEDVSDWVLECEPDDVEEDRTVFTGRREHAQEGSPYVLLVRTEDTFTVTPVQPSWYSFKPTVVSTVPPPPEDGDPDADSTGPRRVRAPHASKPKKPKKTLSSMLSASMNFLQRHEDSERAEREAEFTRKQEKREFDTAVDDGSWDFDIGSTRFVNDESLINDYTADSAHEGQFAAVPKGYDEVDEREEEMATASAIAEGEVDEESEELRRMRGLLKRGRDGIGPLDGEPPKKKRRGEDGSEIVDEDGEDARQAEARRRAAEEEERVLIESATQFLLSQGGKCKPQALLQHLRIPAQNRSAEQQRTFTLLTGFIRKRCTQTEDRHLRLKQLS